MEFEDWKVRVEYLLSELKSIEFGYPLGLNCVHERTRWN